MKKFLKYLSVVFVLAAAPFILAPAADAADSGSEKIVPVIRWKCSQCSTLFHTFAPESLEAKEHNNNKDGAYQQKNWVLFTSNGTSIAKCQRDPSNKGTHLFDKNGEDNLPPHEVAKLDKDKKLIVLKERGQTLKVKVQNWSNPYSNVKGYCFGGDDMDMAPSIDPSRQSNVWNIKTGERIKDANSPGYDNKQFKWNWIVFGGFESVKGYDLSSRAANLWYSD